MGLLSALMAANTQRLEVTLDTQLESVDLAESIVVRVAEAAGSARTTFTSLECRCARA